jgi:hypothetical protein
VSAAISTAYDSTSASPATTTASLSLMRFLRFLGDGGGTVGVRGGFAPPRSGAASHRPRDGSTISPRNLSRKMC